MDATNTTASVEVAEGKVLSGYTTESCTETLYSVNAVSSTTSVSYVEVKSWSFTLADNDYRRELTVEADIEGYEVWGIESPGRLVVELVKPDGSRDLIFSGSRMGSGAQIFSGTKSLDGLAPGDYRIAVSIHGQGFFITAKNRIFRVTLTSKRVYQASSTLRTTAFNADFDIGRITLHDTVNTPAETSVSWSFSSDGGTTWIPIEPNTQVPMYLSQPSRSVLLKAVLSGAETATPVIDSYGLVVSGASNELHEDGLRLTGKELDVSTGLEYFGVRYYDPEVGRFINVDTYTYLPDDKRIQFDGYKPFKILKIGLSYPQFYNRYSYCINNPMNLTDPLGHAAGDIFDSIEDAAADFGRTYNDDSIRHDCEYGASIYEVRDENGNLLGYTYTVPNKCTKHSNEPSTPNNDAKVVATIHTHGAYDGSGNDDYFSPPDMEHEGIIVFLVTPSGELLQLGVSKPIRTDMPSDPKHPHRVNKISPYLNEKDDPCQVPWLLNIFLRMFEND